ncbi:MAG TPA: PaaI family thioesterase, partial [bacterium]|nr:PaaI family thioesterase [bacterium]
AGAVAAILDSACGYAALSLAPAKTTVLAVEFKINLLRPAVGRELLAQAQVLRAGRTLTVCQAECRADGVETDRIVAIMQSTIMLLEEREDLAEDSEVAQCPPQDDEDQNR